MSDTLCVVLFALEVHRVTRKQVAIDGNDASKDDLELAPRIREKTVEITATENNPERSMEHATSHEVGFMQVHPQRLFRGPES